METEKPPWLKGLQIILMFYTSECFCGRWPLTSATPSSSLPSTSLLFSLARSMISSFTITASILDTMLPMECSIRSTRLTRLQKTTVGKDKVTLCWWLFRPVGFSNGSAKVCFLSNVIIWNVKQVAANFRERLSHVAAGGAHWHTLSASPHCVRSLKTVLLPFIQILLFWKISKENN